MAFNKNSYSPDAVARMQALTEELNEQSDRGLAIVGAAWVEEAITGTLESLLHTDTKGWERLFEGNGPMSSFAAKIDILYALGLTSEAIQSDMHRLRAIRNMFAHQITHRKTHSKLTFNTPEIKDRCLALKCVEHEQQTEPREAFIRACAILNADMEMLGLFGVKLLNDVGKVITSNERHAP
jgi:DNA-binding MltR family transcriptional regulator